MCHRTVRSARKRWSPPLDRTGHVLLPIGFQLFTAFRMSATEFSQNEFDLAYPPGVEYNYWTVARNHVLWNTLRTHNWTHKKWIEVGSGRGIVLKHLRKKGVPVHGVELAPVAPLPEIAEYLESGRDICDCPADQRSEFEGVLLLDVIEHLPEPVSFLSQLRASLPNTRHWIITVPACPELWSNYDEFYGHHRRYSPEVLEDQLRQSGLRPIETRYFFHSLYPAARLLLGSGRKREIAIKAPEVWQRPIHQILGLGFYWESRLFPNRWPGTSLMCVAETT